MKLSRTVFHQSFNSVFPLKLKFNFILSFLSNRNRLGFFIKKTRRKRAMVVFVCTLCHLIFGTKKALTVLASAFLDKIIFCCYLQDFIFYFNNGCISSTNWSYGITLLSSTKSAWQEYISFLSFDIFTALVSCSYSALQSASCTISHTKFNNA